MERLKNKILEEGYFLHPIIVDKESRVVLDGMHRVAASKALSLHHIPVCFVDYCNPSVVLRCWYRIFKSLSKVGYEGTLRRLGLKWSKLDKILAEETVNRREALAALLTQKEAIVIYDNVDNIELVYKIIKKLEQELCQGHEMGFTSEKDAKQRIILGDFYACIITPVLTKEEVVMTAKSGRVFPQKTTRHIIPARPMGVKVPIEWLVTDKTEIELNHKLKSYLLSRKVKLTEPGTQLDRRYEEPLYIFQ